MDTPGVDMQQTDLSVLDAGIGLSADRYMTEIIGLTGNWAGQEASEGRSSRDRPGDIRVTRGRSSRDRGFCSLSLDSSAVIRLTRARSGFRAWQGFRARQ